jgi:hypothetical protein
VVLKGRSTLLCFTPVVGPRFPFLHGLTCLNDGLTSTANLCSFAAMRSELGRWALPGGECIDLGGAGQRW